MQRSNGEAAVSQSPPGTPTSFPPLPPPSSSRLRPYGGLTPPFHPLQVSAWVLLVVCVVIYYTLCVAFVPDGHDAEKWAFIFVYLGIWLLGFGLWLAVSLSDPFVPLQAEGKAAEHREGGPLLLLSSVPTHPPPAASSSSAPAIAGAAAAAEADASRDGFLSVAEVVPPSTTSFPQPASAPPPTSAEPSTAASQEGFSPPAASVSRCPQCGAVQGSTTKHCYLDGRCVDGFDHHCVYLNTCVGKRTYPLFFSFVSCVTALLCLQLFVTIWLLAHYHDADYRGAADSSALSSPLAWLLLLSIVSVFPFLCLLGIWTLQCFHCYLLATCQSTYQFIVKRRAMMDERQWQWEEQQRQLQRQWQQQWQPQALAQTQWQPPAQLPSSSSHPPPSGAEALIVLTDRQLAEQAEWLKAQQRKPQRPPSAAGPASWARERPSEVSPAAAAPTLLPVQPLSDPPTAPPPAAELSRAAEPGGTEEVRPVELVPPPLHTPPAAVQGAIARPGFS